MDSSEIPIPSQDDVPRPLTHSTSFQMMTSGVPKAPKKALHLNGFMGSSSHSHSSCRSGDGDDTVEHDGFILRQNALNTSGDLRGQPQLTMPQLGMHAQSTPISLVLQNLANAVSDDEGMDDDEYHHHGHHGSYDLTSPTKPLSFNSFVNKKRNVCCALSS